MTLGSFRRFQADDYVMAVILCFWTTLIVTINIVRHTSSNLLPPGYPVHDLTPQDVKERAYGSKLILVVEQSQCVTIWGTKICLILLYLRITSVLRENLFLKVLFGYGIGSFIIMDILYFGVWCQPFHNYWAVPTPNRQCDAATNHLITNAVFNLSSDVAMLLIGLPMFLRMKLPWKKKIPIIGVFSLGIFTIISAILNKVYSFTRPFGAEWTYWYVRESATALLVTNLPFVWTIIRKMTGQPQTIKGTSRHDSLSPQDALSRHEYGRGSDENCDYAGAQKLENYEMKDSPPTVGRRMTFAEMLGGDASPFSIADDEPSEITHPALFYTKGSSSASKPQPEMEKAAFDEMEFQTVQGETDADKTPTSSVYPQLRDKESTNSFV